MGKFLESAYQRFKIKNVMISNPCYEMHLTNKDDEKYIKIYYSFMWLSVRIHLRTYKHQIMD